MLDQSAPFGKSSRMLALSMAPNAAVRTGTHGETEILRGLWQGGAPSRRSVADGRYDVVVLCAAEYQPTSAELASIQAQPFVEHAPFGDSRSPSRRELQIAFQAAERVARHVRAGKKVLVSCAMGINRSGLVTALAVRAIARVPGRIALEHVRSVRPFALSNETFREILRSLP